MSTQNLAIRLYPEPLQSIAFDAANSHSSYPGTLLGTLANPSRIFELQNLTDAQMFFSFDNVNDHFTLPADSFLLLDLTANKSNVGQVANFAQGQNVYVRRGSVSATTGNVYLSTIFGIGVTV
jgi:hypothetical protein